MALFLALVLYGLSLVSAASAWSIGAVIAVLALGAAATLRAGFGYLFGWLTQVALIAAGYYIPDMYLLGAIFLALWIASVVLGGRIDVEREERYRAEVAYYQRQHPDQPADQARDH